MITWLNILLVWLIISEAVARTCLFCYERKRGHPVKDTKITYLALWLTWPLFVAAYPLWRRRK